MKKNRLAAIAALGLSAAVLMHMPLYSFAQEMTPAAAAVDLSEADTDETEPIEVPDAQEDKTDALKSAEALGEDETEPIEVPDTPGEDETEPTPVPDAPSDALTKPATLEEMILHLYSTTLNRGAAQSEIDAWANAVRGGLTGAELVRGFVESPEFHGKVTEKADYIAALYRAVLCRNGSQEEIDKWVQNSAGRSRDYLLQEFVNSPEFQGLCNTVRIERGTFRTGSYADRNDNLAAFLERLYVNCLGRSADQPGIDSWVYQITQNGMTAAEVSQGFFSSPEFEEKALSDEDFVRTLYRTYLGREGADAEITNWVNVYREGFTKEYLMRGFIASSEFTGICENFQVSRGDLTLTDSADIHPAITHYVSDLYQVMLNDPDRASQRDWILRLANTEPADELLQMAFCSEKYQSRGTSDEEFIRDIYRIGMQQEPSEAAMSVYLKRLQGISRSRALNYMSWGNDFKAFCDGLGIIPTITSDPYPLATAKLDTVGWNLSAAFKAAAATTYYGHTADMPQVSTVSPEWYAEYGFTNGKGNCYVMAAMFWEMAAVMSYDVHMISGTVPLAAGGSGPHSWTEITIDGATYVCDPDFQHETGRNGYMITYGASGTWRYNKQVTMN